MAWWSRDELECDTARRRAFTIRSTARRRQHAHSIVDACTDDESVTMQQYDTWQERQFNVWHGM